MEFFACFHEFYNMGKKNRGVKKSHQTKNLKFAIVVALSGESLKSEAKLGFRHSGYNEKFL